jgi:hypothetical protein
MDDLDRANDGQILGGCSAFAVHVNESDVAESPLCVYVNDPSSLRSTVLWDGSILNSLVLCMVLLSAPGVGGSRRGRWDSGCARWRRGAGREHNITLGYRRHVCEGRIGDFRSLMRPCRRRLVHQVGFLPSGLYGTGQGTRRWIPSMEYIHGHPFDQASAVPVIMLATALLVAGAVLIYQRLEL